MSKYIIDIRPESRDLCVFLNDGVDIPITDEPQFLYIEIDDPREITTKILTLPELGSPEYRAIPIFKP